MNCTVGEISIIELENVHVPNTKWKKEGKEGENIICVSRSQRPFGPIKYTILHILKGGDGNEAAAAHATLSTCTQKFIVTNFLFVFLFNFLLSLRSTRIDPDIVIRTDKFVVTIYRYDTHRRHWSEIPTKQKKKIDKKKKLKKYSRIWKKKKQIICETKANFTVM